MIVLIYHIECDKGEEGKKVKMHGSLPSPLNLRSKNSCIGLFEVPLVRSGICFDLSRRKYSLIRS